MGSDPPSTDRSGSLPDGRDTEPVAPHEAPGATSPEATPKATGSDTLLSAPAPADARDLEVDDRLESLELSRDDLERRLRKLEKQPREGGPSWLIWVVFLLALAVGWLVVSRAP